MEICNFELAKKLKEKGFPIKNKTEGKFGLTEVKSVEILPTISQVLKWLREEKGLHICINIYDDGWFFDISSFYKQDSGVYEVELPYMSSNVTPDYETYEQAALAGVNYCLDNLI